MNSLIGHFHPYFMHLKRWEVRFDSIDASINQQSRNEVRSRVEHEVAIVIGTTRFFNGKIHDLIREELWVDAP